MQSFDLKNKILGFLANSFRNVAELLETRISLGKTSSSEQENKNEAPDALEDWLKRTASVRKEEWMGFNKESLPNLADDLKEEINQNQLDKQPTRNQQKLDLPQAREHESPTFDRDNNFADVSKRNKIEFESKENRLDTTSVYIHKKPYLSKLRDVAKPLEHIEQASDNPKFVGKDKIITDSTFESKDIKTADSTFESKDVKAADSIFERRDERKQGFEKTSFTLFKTKDKQSKESKFESKIADLAKRNKSVDFKLQSPQSRKKTSESNHLISFRKTDKTRKENSQINKKKSSVRKIEKTFEKQTFNEKTYSNGTIFEEKTINEKTYSNEIPSVVSKHKTSNSRSNNFETEGIGKNRNVEKIQISDYTNTFEPKNITSESFQLSPFSKQNEAEINGNKFRTFKQNTRNNNEQIFDKTFDVNDNKWIELPEPFEDGSIGNLERSQLETQQLQALESEQTG